MTARWVVAYILSWSFPPPKVAIIPMRPDLVIWFRAGKLLISCELTGKTMSRRGMSLRFHEWLCYPTREHLSWGISHWLMDSEPSPSWATSKHPAGCRNSKPTLKIWAERCSHWRLRSGSAQAPLRKNMFPFLLISAHGSIPCNWV